MELPEESKLVKQYFFVNHCIEAKSLFRRLVIENELIKEPFYRYYMYHSKQNSLVWCKVPKAGSSTWTYNFLKLAGVNPKDVSSPNFFAANILFLFSENPQSTEGSLPKAGQQQNYASELKWHKC